MISILLRSEMKKKYYSNTCQVYYNSICIDIDL